MLVLELAISGAAFISLGLSPTYTTLLIAMGFVGLSGSVFHPADYAILSAQIAPVRLGRAFSIHTFAGFLGTAVAPVAMLAVAASVGLKAAMFATGAVALVASLPLILVRGIDNRAPAMHAAGAVDGYIADAKVASDLFHIDGVALVVKLELRAMTKSQRMRDSAVMISSTIPSAKYSCSGSPLILAKGSTAIDGLSGSGGGGLPHPPHASGARHPLPHCGRRGLPAHLRRGG